MLRRDRGDSRGRGRRGQNPQPEREIVLGAADDAVANRDGVVIETKPATRRYSGSGSATLNCHFSLLGTIDYTIDDMSTEIRLLSGLTYRIR